MRHISLIGLIILLLPFIATAPTAQAQRSATATPTTTPHVKNDSTATPDDSQNVKGVGFTFRPAQGYKIESEGKEIVLSDSTQTIFIAFSGDLDDPSDPSLQELLDQAFLRDVEGLKLGTPYPITVGGIEGLAVDFTRKIGGQTAQGQIVAVIPRPKQIFLALGLAFTTDDPKHWENDGRKVFETVLSSVKFSAASRTVGTCPISTDKTYGYTKENPIKVGGDVFGGPPRERAYLDNLLGPNGEKLSYIRTGSLETKDAILDTYEVTGLKTPVTLYIDMYHYESPQAPIGFACAGPFLSAP